MCIYLVWTATYRDDVLIVARGYFFSLFGHINNMRSAEGGIESH